MINSVMNKFVALIGGLMNIDPDSPHIIGRSH